MATDPWQRLAKLGISMSNCRPYTPAWRAILERRWGIVPLIWQRQAVGVVECDWYERGRQQKYPWDAVYTLSEFMTQVLRAIHVYHRTPVTGIPLHPEMTFDRQANTPLNRWRWGIENLSGSPQYEYAVEDIQLATWFRYERPLTARGIHINGRFYTSQETEAAWFARSRKDRNINVYCDPDDLRGIWVELDGYRVYCASTNDGQAIAPLSWIEQRQFIEQGNENDREEVHAQTPARIRQMNDSRVDTEISKNRTKDALADAGLAHPATGDMADTRRSEAALGRSLQHPRNAAPPQQPDNREIPDPSDEHPTSLIDERDAAAMNLLGRAAGRHNRSRSNGE